MPHLYRHLRIHQVFGANTDVGKTILTTALCKATAASRPVFYLKPVSTGPAGEADDSHVASFTKGLRTACLFKFDDPVSPHLAVKMKGLSPNNIPSDNQFISAISDHIVKTATSVPSDSTACMYIETAGGVHSPTPSGTTQAEAYRPLRFPTILIGDARLGGISATISAYESLLLRGYDIDSLLLFRDEYYRNWEYLSDWCDDKNVKIGVIPPPPIRHSDQLQDQRAMSRYYEEIRTDESLQAIISHLDNAHHKRIENVKSMPQRTLGQIWWPFVQHGLVAGKEDVTVIDSAHGDHFDATPFPTASSSPSSLKPSLLQPMYDGSASWWTQSVGHAHPSLTLAAAYAAGRYGHVIFPLAIHQPALDLAERLIHRGPGKGWACRVFFSDNGSTGMEVAIKMAIRAVAQRKGSKKELEVIGLKGSYHGDTIGAMDACEGGVYNSAVEWYRGRGYWFDVPTVAFRNGSLTVKFTREDLGPTGGKTTDPTLHEEIFPSLSAMYDVEARLTSDLAGIYRTHIHHTLERLVKEGRSFGALIIEPLVMGAGGMLFVDPLFHRTLVNIVRDSGDLLGTGSKDSAAAGNAWKGLPIIFDEVFTGLYRVGVQSANSILKVNPDISVLAKILTGGLIPLSVTLASSSIFDAFSSDKKVDALLHGHSYTAHPIGCAVANESLRLIDELQRKGVWDDARQRWNSATSIKEDISEAWSFWHPDFVQELSKKPLVREVMTLGTVLAFQLDTVDGGYSSTLAQSVMEPLRQPTAAANGNSDGNAIHFRTLGDVAYFMASLNTSESTFRALENRILSTLATS